VACPNPHWWKRAPTTFKLQSSPDRSGRMPQLEAAGATRQACKRNSRPSQGWRERQKIQTWQIHVPQSRVIFSAKRWDILTMEVKSPSKPQSTRGVELLTKHVPIKNTPLRMSTWSLFKLLQKSNKLKLPEARRPDEVGKIDDPNYCLYHRMLGHPTKSCYIFKDVFKL